MKKILILPLAFLLSCATPITKKDSINTYIIKTGQSKSNAFDKIMTYFAKSINNSNNAIKLKNKNSGKIISKFGIECNELDNALLKISSFIAHFTIEIDIKDQKAKLRVQAESFTHYSSNGNIISINSPFTESHKGAIKKCSARLRDDLKASLTTSNSNW